MPDAAADVESAIVVASAVASPRYAPPPLTPAEEGPASVMASQDTGAALAAPASFVDTCRVLYDAGRFDEVVSTATPAVIGATPSESDAAILWSLLGRSLWALHDSDPARLALQSALQISPDNEKDTYQRQLRSIALVAADDLMVRSAEVSEDAERLDLLRSAREWLLAGGVGLESGEQAHALITEIERAYWPACESQARARLAAGAFGEAYDIASNALADVTLPDDRRPSFAEVLGEALEGEIGRLAASAIESVERGRDWDTLRSLERAEALSKAAIDVPSDRRATMNRDLWRAYTRLGVMRVDAEEFETALDPLFRALRVPGIDAATRDETRWAMVKALDGLVTVRAATIRDVVASGHGDAAVVQAERLWTVLRSGIAAGAPQEARARAPDLTRASRGAGSRPVMSERPESRSRSLRSTG